VNQELLHLIEQISREKGVEKSVVIDAVLSAVLSAARKRFWHLLTISIHVAMKSRVPLRFFLENGSG